MHACVYDQQMYLHASPLMKVSQYWCVRVHHPTTTYSELFCHVNITLIRSSWILALSIYMCVHMCTVCVCLCLFDSH